MADGFSSVRPCCKSLTGAPFKVLLILLLPLQVVLHHSSSFLRCVTTVTTITVTQLLSLLLSLPQPKHHLVHVWLGMSFDHGGADRTATVCMTRYVLSFQLCPQETVARRQCRPSGAAKCQGGITAAPCWHGSVQMLHSCLVGGDPRATRSRERGARNEDEKQRGTKHSSYFSAASNELLAGR